MLKCSCHQYLKERMETKQMQFQKKKEKSHYHHKRLMKEHFRKESWQTLKYVEKRLEERVTWKTLI